MYENPIEILYGKIQCDIEDGIYKAVQHAGITVNRDELIKALKYDRGQYEKGYEDAKRECEKDMWTTREVACLLAEVTGDVFDAARWEQWLTHRKERNNDYLCRECSSYGCDIGGRE